MYATSVSLGVRDLVRHGYRREALRCVLIPLDPSRYLELPWALARLEARPGQRVLDLASPKLLALTLARRGVDVISVDQFEREIATWHELTAGEDHLQFTVADGRELPFGDASFDHAYSISVLEHIPDGGDATALAELARVVRPGGRVLVTLPFASAYREDWRESAFFVNEPTPGRAFFQRWYDGEHLERLAAAVPALELTAREIVRMEPNWNEAYTRTFPWLLPLGPFYGLLGREVAGPGGDVARLEFVTK